MANFVSFKNKLVDFGIQEGNFDNDKGENVKYKQTVIVVDLDGEKETIVLSGATAPKPKVLAVMLRGASKATVNGSMLDDEE